MTSAPALRHLAPLAVLAAAFALWQPVAVNAQSGERYDDRPPAGDRGYGDDRDRDDDRDGPPRDGWRDDDARRDYGRRDDDRRDADRGRSSDAFYDDLDQYGRWEEHPRYGDIWTPDDVGRGWRPYTVGHWTFTEEYGWYWASNEPWGWATYHYGRWAWDDRFGWFWIPGDEWAPAWVTWRYSDDFIGWAPLPPRGHRFGDDYFASAAFASAWIFVRPRFFAMQGLHRFAQPASLNARTLTMTRSAGMPQRSGQRTVNPGLDLRTVERITQRQITPSRIAITENRNDPSILKPRFGSITVYRPRNLTGGPSGNPSRWSQPQNAPPAAAGRRSAPTNAAPPPGATAPPGADTGRPGGFERRRAGGSPPPSTNPAPAAPAAAPPAAAPTPSPSPSAAPPQPPPQRDRDRDRPRADQRPPAPPPQPQTAPPAPQSGTPVQPRILNQAPPTPPPARPAPPPAAAASPPKPAPPAAPPAAVQAKPAPPAKDHKDREHKKKPEGDPPPPPKQ